VQKDIRGTTPEIKQINTNVLLLPVVGFVMYLMTRRQREPMAADTLMGKVAGMKVDEAPKKRGLLGGGTKTSGALSARRESIALEFLNGGGEKIEIRQDTPEMTGIEAAREVLGEAITERASDIHIEPHADGCGVRFRIDGTLQERMTFTRADGL